MDHQGNLIPDPEADYNLFDRVINVSTTNAVPFGLRGTITGILSNDSDSSSLYEIAFDEEFLGGVSLRCSSNRAYRLPPSCLLNISYGQRLEKEKEGPKFARQGVPKDSQGVLSYAEALQSVYGGPHMAHSFDHMYGRYSLGSPGPPSYPVWEPPPPLLTSGPPDAEHSLKPGGRYKSPPGRVAERGRGRERGEVRGGGGRGDNAVSPGAIMQRKERRLVYHSWPAPCQVK